MTEDEPDWTLLPERPAEFFGLDDEYTLQDLRRAYARLIRRYKPDRAPTEFQRIRTAYEGLNEALRYGTSLNHLLTPETPSADWNSRDEPEPPVEEQAARSTDSSESLHRSGEKHLKQRRDVPLYVRLSSVPPLTLYQELQGRQEKSAEDYFQLALLSDVVEQDSLSFARWLLKGLDARPGDAVLFHLLQEHLAEPASPSHRIALAELAAEFIKTDHYYRLTERLWLRLLRETSFDVFRDALDRCERRLVDLEFNHQTIFYVALLRPAIWRADDDWFDAKLQVVDEQHASLSAWTQNELEFLELVQAYRNRRYEFTRLGPLAQQMDRAIVEFCSREEVEADLAFLECQHILATSGEDLLVEFPLATRDLKFARIVWMWIWMDVLGRTPLSNSAMTPEHFELRVRGLAFDLMDDRDGTPLGLILNTFYILVFFTLVGWAGWLVYGTYQIFADVFVRGEYYRAFLQLLTFLGGVVGTVAALLISIWFHDNLFRHYYRRLWRARTMQFLETGPYALSSVADELNKLSGKTIADVEIKDTDEIAKLIRNDVALELYLMAHRLLVG